MKEIVVTKKNEGQKIEKFIRKYLPSAPLSVIYKLFRIRDVKVNDIRVKNDFILHENDVVKIYLPDDKIEEFIKDDSLIDVSYHLDIVYEDQNILIINKNGNLLVHGDNNEKRLTLNNFVLNYLTKKGEYEANDTFTPSPCHRLDRNTSGLIIYAKNFVSLNLLTELFKNKKELEKKYLGLVVGQIIHDGEINVPLFKDEKRNLVFVKSLSQGGKEALTKYKVIRNFKKFTLLELNLITGRTHQLRVHLSYIHHPLIGDQKYGDFNENKLFDQKYNYHSQFLHAKEIHFLNIPEPLSYLSNRTFVASLGKKEQNIIESLE